MPITVNGVQVPLESGICQTGAHEGTRPKSYAGVPRQVCLLSWCECECHKKLDEMFAMMEMERTPQDNPEYIPPERTYWMPSDDPEYRMPAASSDFTEDGSVAVLEKEVKVTDSGRTQRGGLEFWVQRECLAWILDHDEGELCTPKFLSAEIARVEGIKPPSQGAISAVFDRWERYGYARIGRDRPQRFLGLTEQGEKQGLDWCRANAKKAK